jgi:hypothetical protein
MTELNYEPILVAIRGGSHWQPSFCSFCHMFGLWPDKAQEAIVSIRQTEHGYWLRSSI